MLLKVTHLVYFILMSSSYDVTLGGAEDEDTADEGFPAMTLLSGAFFVITYADVSCSTFRYVLTIKYDRICDLFIGINLSPLSLPPSQFFFCYCDFLNHSSQQARD